MKIKNPSLPLLGFLQASGLVLYLFLVSQAMFRFSTILGPSTSEFLAPIVFLLLFVISVVTCGFLVLAKAGLLFWEKRYKESFTLIGWTIGWSALYLIGIVLILANSPQLAIQPLPQSVPEPVLYQQ